MAKGTAADREHDDTLGDSKAHSVAENVRRVYALPADMVDRITSFQREKGLTSEVEAVRRLLDEALMSRDDLDMIINRLLAKLGQTKIAAEAARDVLVGHPLVVSINFEDNAVSFELKNQESATVNESGHVSVRLPSGLEPEWTPRNRDNRYAGGVSGIPF